MITRFLPIILSVLLHEAGHLLMFYVCGVKLKSFSLKLTEARLNAAGFISYEKEFSITAGGPAANLLTAGIAMLLPSCELTEVFVSSSLCLIFLNLLPITELDGGRILSSLCGILFTSEIQRRICDAADIAGIVFLWLVSVYFMIKSASGISLFFFAFMLMARLTQSKET